MPIGIKGFQKGHPQFNTGRTRFQKGHKMLKEVKEKIRKTLKGRYIGELSSNWKGGVWSNEEKRKQHQRIYYLKFRKRLLEKQKEYYQKNKQQIIKNVYEWCLANPQKASAIQKRYRIKRNENPKFHLARIISIAIWKCLKKKKANRNWESLVNYTLEVLMEHLENQFDEKMNWSNYGKYWSIDHKKPISLFNYINPEDEEFKKCWALENLQPMEKIANIKKGNHF